MTHQELIAALTEATGRDTTLNGRIGLLTGNVVSSFSDEKLSERDKLTFARSAALVAKDFTGSIDAAVTLIPKNVFWMIGYGRVRPGEPFGACTLFRDGQREPFLEAEGNTPELAVCIAALKARAQTGGGK